MSVKAIEVEVSINRSAVECEVGIAQSVVGCDVSIGRAVYVNGQTYTGATEIEPDFDGAILETAHKLVMDNINIHPIQVESVSNLSGGRTVYIGGII